MKEILKKFFKWALLIWAGALLLAWLVRPVVESYGQAVLQFDEAEKTYFVQTEFSRADVQEVRGSEEMFVGMPVTYYKTHGCVMNVYSGFVPEDVLRAASLRGMREGCIIGAAIISLVVLFGVIDKHRQGV